MTVGICLNSTYGDRISWATKKPLNTAFLGVALRIRCPIDPAMEDMLYEVKSVRRFAGVSPEKVPDETTIPTSTAGWSAKD